MAWLSTQLATSMSQIDYRSAVVVLRGLDVPGTDTEVASLSFAQHAFAEPYILSVDKSGNVYVPDSILNTGLS